MPFDTSRIDGRTIGVLGLGRSGLSCTRYLVGQGAITLAFDDNERPKTKAAALGAIPGRLSDIEKLDALIASPGVPFRFPTPHPVIAECNHLGVPILSDLDLFQAIKGQRPVIGVTGTNGKSTTSALIDHILQTCGRASVLGGNIGTAVLDLDIGNTTTSVVLELSSYQLDLIQSLHCNIAVWLNITPDHLDRHGGLEGYVDAKTRIFDRQQSQDTAVISIDDAHSRAVAEALAHKGKQCLVRIAMEDQRAEIHCDGTTLIDALDGTPTRVGDLSRFPRLAGRHNHQNIQAAYAALRIHGLASDEIMAAIASFAGLPHRAEWIGSHHGIGFVNDSKATNPAAAAKSLGTYDNIYWLAGGVAKDGGFADLEPALKSVVRAYFYGECKQTMQSELGKSVVSRVYDDLDAAIDASWHDARDAKHEESTVLLAPACASFDQFSSFEERGDHFRNLARALIAEGVA